MDDSEDAKLKSEIDQIMKNIDETIKKIEKIVPLEEWRKFLFGFFMRLYFFLKKRFFKILLLFCGKF